MFHVGEAIQCIDDRLHNSDLEDLVMWKVYTVLRIEHGCMVLLEINGKRQRYNAKNFIAFNEDNPVF